MSDRVERTSLRRKRRGAGHLGSMWWRDPSAGEAMLNVAGALKKQQESRNRAWLRYGRLYANQYLGSLYDNARARDSHDDTYLAMNCVRVNIETAEAKLVRNRPRVVIDTAGGDWSMQRQAAGLSKFLLGDQQRAGFHRHQRKVFQAATTFGTGVTKIYRDDSDRSRVACESVPPWELLIDDYEAQDGETRSVIRMKPIHRETIAEWFPEHRDKLLDMEGWSPGGRESSSDLLLLYEGHHVGAGKDPGRRVLALEGFEGSLGEDEWSKDYVPYVPFRWSPRPLGYWGSGIAEALIGLQIAINDVNEAIERQQHLVSGPKVFVRRNSGINPDDLTNQYAPVIECDDEPKFMVISGVDPQLFMERDRLWELSFQLVGNSEMDATGLKPVGLNSGEAQRVHQEIASARHVVIGQDWEDAHVSVAEMWIDVARDCYQGTDYRVAYKDAGDRVMREIAWSKVNLKRDSLVFGRFPVSGLPTTPSAKQEKLREWFADGLIDKATFMALAEVPDLEAYSSMANAGLDDIKQVIEDIIDDGRYEAPTEYQNLKVGIPLVNSAYLRYKRLGLPAKRAEMLLRWMDEASFITGDQAPASMPTLAPDPAMLAAAAPAVQAVPGMAAPMALPPLPTPGAPMAAPPVPGMS